MSRGYFSPRTSSHCRLLPRIQQKLLILLAVRRIGCRRSNPWFASALPSFRPTQAPHAYSAKQRTCRGQSSSIHGRRWRLELRFFVKRKKKRGPQLNHYHTTPPFSFAHTTLVTRGYPLVVQCSGRRHRCRKDYIRNCSPRSGGTATVVQPVKRIGIGESNAGTQREQECTTPEKH